MPLLAALFPTAARIPSPGASKHIEVIQLVIRAIERPAIRESWIFWNELSVAWRDHHLLWHWVWLGSNSENKGGFQIPNGQQS